MRGYVNRLVQSAGKKKTYDDLLDIIVREQVLSVCSKDMSVFIRVREPKTLKELTTMADRYRDIHGRSTNRKSDNRMQKNQTNQNSGNNQSNSSSSRKSNSASSLTCFVCGKRGHMAQNCR